MISTDELVELVNYFAQTKEVQMYMKYMRMLNESRNKIQEQNNAEASPNS
jgi:hypothetical protein